jgi:hypothetical protein
VHPLHDLLIKAPVAERFSFFRGARQALASLLDSVSQQDGGLGEPSQIRCDDGPPGVVDSSTRLAGIVLKMHEDAK